MSNTFNNITEFFKANSFNSTYLPTILKEYFISEIILFLFETTSFFLNSVLRIYHDLFVDYKQTFLDT